MLLWFKRLWFGLWANPDDEPASLGSDELLWRVQEIGRQLDALREQRKQFSDVLRNRIGG